LISEGAQILTSAQDVLEFLDISQLGEQRIARTILPADATEAQLFEVLGHEPLHVDEIRARANLPIEKVSAALTLMELKGMIRQVGGMNYVALYEPRADYQVE
jgi:DNA processing protein